MKKEEEKHINFTSKIIGISLSSFKVETLNAKDTKSLKDEQFAYEYNVSFRFDDNTSSIKLNCVIKVYSDISKNLYLGEIESNGNFELKNYIEIKDEFRGSIPIAILSTFASVLLSTTRGFLILKSEKTIMNGAILPLINAQTLFNQPVLPSSLPPKAIKRKQTTKS